MVRPGKRVGYQIMIDRFFSENDISPGEQPPDKSAFCRARKKLPLDIMMNLFEKATDYALSLAGRFENLTWKGFRVYAIDGTKKNMPNSKELREHFRMSQGAHFPQMLTCVLFDVLAKIPVDMMWGPFDTSERQMAKHLCADLGLGDLLLLDRGYPGFEIISDMLRLSLDFLIRLPKTGMFKEVGEFLSLGKRDGIVVIHPSKEIVRQCKNEGKPVPDSLRLRIVKARLPGKGTAVFITSLMDRKAYSLSEIRDLYHLRWEEEEFFKTVKELLEAENFRGQSVQFIDQEMIAVYLYALLTRILIMESALAHGIQPSEIAEKAAFHSVSRFLDKIWLCEDEQDCQRLIFHCLKEISWRKYKKRPGRRYPRKCKRSYGKWARKSAA